MLRRLLQPRHGQRVLTERDLALNLSFVLHERSESAAVQRVVRACQSHARTLHRLDADLIIPSTGAAPDQSDVTFWITATIGLPHLLAGALGVPPESVVTIDAEAPILQAVEFFRAPAQLALPGPNHAHVGVAALILRPGRRTSHLAVSGIHVWPSARDDVVRAVERLIQAHPGQWMPPRALWPAPAEAMLSAEVS